MAGKRVLLAAELLRGGATLTRLLPLAGALAKLGHQVSFAVPNGVEAAVAGFPVVEALRWSVPPLPGYAAISYADVLMHSGYAAPEGLDGLMMGWRGVLEQVRPDWLIVDFAPTAMLAARVAGVPVAAVGDGFSLPPLTAPLPAIRSWVRVPADEIASVEGRVLAVINARLRADRASELRDLRDLFDGVPAFLCTFPELDHYQQRAESAWYGAVFPASSGPQAVWPAAEGERVYVDLDPRHPALPGIADALDQLGYPALIQGAGVAEPLAASLERRLVRVTTAAVNRDSLLAGCDVVVCQGLEVGTPALLAGKRLLMLPVFVEQMMTLRRVMRQGLGHGVAPDSVSVTIGAALCRLLDDEDCRLRAVNFGRAYHGYHPGIAIEAVAEEIGTLLTA